jgi:hypothetical protein
MPASEPGVFSMNTDTCRIMSQTSRVFVKYYGIMSQSSESARMIPMEHINIDSSSLQDFGGARRLI